MNEQLCVLIIDSDKGNRNSYKKLVDWEKLDCYIACEAETAEDALEKIRLFRPNLVVTNTTISNKDDGIDIIRQVMMDSSTFRSRPHFLAVTEDRSFETAQKVLAAGAKGILALPLSLNSDINSIIVNIINYYRSYIQGYRCYVLSQEEQKMESLRQMFINNAITDATYKELIDSNDHQIILISPVLCGYKSNLKDFERYTEQMLMPLHYHRTSIDSIYIYVFINEDEDIIQRYVSKMFEKLRKPDSACGIVIGGKHHGMEGALRSYNEARAISGYTTYFKERTFLNSQIILEGFEDKSITQISPVVEDIPAEIYRSFMEPITQFIQFVEIYDLDRVNSVLEDRAKVLQTYDLSIEALRKICIAFVIQAQDSIHKRHPEKVFQPIDTLNFVSKIYSRYYFTDIIEILKEFTSKLAEAFANVANDSKILKIVQYVRDNFNTDIKLESIATLFDCNSAYLGKKFHEFTGVSFNTFLDDLRIAKAKEYLKENKYKIYEISGMLGYSNTDYFYLKFKKATGMTPKEFQKENP